MPTERIDRFLDKRWETAAAATDEVAKALKDWMLDCSAVEKLLREGRSAYGEPPQPRGKLSEKITLPLDHLDHETEYFLYVPKSYDPKKGTPVLIVGHGGSSGRDIEFGRRAAMVGMAPFWTDCAEKKGFLLMAPISDRGWGAI